MKFNSTIKRYNTYSYKYNGTSINISKADYVPFVFNVSSWMSKLQKNNNSWYDENIEAKL